MNQNENDNSREQQVKQKLLDSYFLFRRPLPEEGYIQENKTTLQIIDELELMMTVGNMDVVEYMDAHDYSFTTEQDGTVKWAIWRQV